ncbi:hypothetical protein SAMN04487921_12638 [Bacillus altitudinis]|uniref:DUF5365 family protein n=1 Tax=Bacillus altitudinis TaxID=293387 RepID=UPI00090F5194|nr:DUF5365 family protein [Bacillus altitudinis]SFY19085.1 hypothetical protein SAMN04487921_12638 [Bacillus altitudinis]SNS71629.1 hypothetical protein SAMN05880584_12738 [Bacillus altitudinis]
MRLMKAATDLQEQEIEEISKEIEDLLSHSVNVNGEEQKKQPPLTFIDGVYNGTMDDAFRILSGLQLLHTIILKPKRHMTKRDRELFELNREQVNACGFSFPFDLDDFAGRHLQNA